MYLTKLIYSKHKIIKDIYLDIENELELRTPYNPNMLINVQNPYNYSLRRALIESIDGGTDVFKSEGNLVTIENSMTQLLSLNDQRFFEGWKHED